MNSKEIDNKFNLKNLAERMSANLKQNDYVERAIGVCGEDYNDLKVKLKWEHSEIFGANAHVVLEIMCSNNQIKNIKLQISDEDKLDSIDSGCEDELRELIQEVWGELDFEWGYGGTKIKAASS